MNSLLFTESNFQETRAGRLPHNWELKKLSDVADFWNGKAHEQVIDENGEFIVINSKFVSSNGNVAKYCNELISPLNKNDIVLVMSDIPNGKAIAKCFYVKTDSKYTLNQRIGGIRSVNMVSGFLYYVLNRNSYFLKFDDGVQQTNLRKDDILSCPIQVPPFREQAVIANILKMVDKKIQLIDNKIKYTNELKKGLVQKLFSEGIGLQDTQGTWKKHRKYQDSIFGKIPSIWKVYSVDEITKEHKQGFYSKDSYSSMGTKLIRITDLSNPNINWDKMPKLPASDKDIKSYSVSIGDFLFARSGAIGRYGIVDRDESAIFASYLIRFRFCPKLINPYFFGVFYESYLAQSQITAISQGNANININAENIKTIKLPLPPLSEQGEMMKVFGSVDTKLSYLKDQKIEVQRLKKGLMQKLLTGEWRVNLDKVTEKQVALEA